MIRRNYGSSFLVLHTARPVRRFARRLNLAQTDDFATEFVSEEYGITATLPAGWEVRTAGDNWDIAFVSPEAMTQSEGSFMIFRMIPTLSADVTYGSMLQPLLEGTDLAITPVTVAGAEGSEIVATDDTGTMRDIIVPYGTEGGALYIHALAVAGEEDLVNGIIESMTIHAPEVDAAAIDAAWQTSSRGARHTVLW